MKQFFSLSFQHKVILGFLLLMNLPFFFTGYMAKSLSETMVLREKESKLLGYARILEASLDPGGFRAILEREGALAAGREERIAVLNRALKPISDIVGRSAPGLGVGFYSLELEAILTYGPSENFAQNVGRTIPPDHPGREVMRANQAMVSSGHMVRGDILNAMIPLERDGTVIGYIWANELTTDISAQISAMGRNVLLVMITCFVLTFLLLLLLSRRTVRDVDRIIRGVRAMRKDLSSRIEDSGGELGEVVRSINAMAADISRANEESSRAVSVLQSVMSNVDAAVYVCDPQSKGLAYTNQYLRKLLQREIQPGELCYEALRQRESPCPFCPQTRLFDQEGRPCFDSVHWEWHSERLKRDFLITDRLVQWHDGRLLHMQVATDITERKALALAEAANLAQRDFLARMSYEIRTPMNGVLGMTRLALQADPPPAQREYLKKIQSSASLLLGIINDILDFSRIEAGKLDLEEHAFNLHELVDNTRELILPRILENNLELRVTLDPALPEWVSGDGLRLTQVLLNLLGNASKFTLRGHVELHMRAEPLPEDGRLLLHCTVRDSGIGMTEEQVSALFRPFSQADSSTSRKFGGTGLGLSISKALVELMGGSIRAESESGRGSAFIFSVLLQALDGPPVEAQTSEAHWENATYEGLTLLLVEDNAINQEIAVAVLTDLGATVDVANNGEEGVNAFLDKDYALILMDVRMPVMDGLEATRRIRRSAKHDAAVVPIIAMTANAMREDREASREAGMNGHIAKPIDVAELKSALYLHLKG